MRAHRGSPVPPTADLERELKEKSEALHRAHRELSIEASVDRVRTVALSMRSPAELTTVCTTLFNELRSLGFDDLRNAMVNIHYDDQGFFLDYDYSGAIGATLTSVSYDDNHPAVARYLQQVRTATDAFAAFAITAQEMEQWKEFRRRTGQPDDPTLKDGAALYYYFYSIESGSIGISTFSVASPGQLELLKRFRNVFDFSYRRYMDLSLAEAQAREAQIEASMEKVRGRAMAMHSTGDLAAATAVIFAELRRLGIESVRCGVVLLSRDSREARAFTTSASRGRDSLELIGSFPMTGHPTLENQYRCWLSQENYFTTVSGEDLRARYDLLRSSLPVPYLPPETGEHEEHGYFFSFSEGQFYVWTRERYAAEAIGILTRFKTIVELTFRRYLDLQRVEAQAREAQIEASLERVRSRTLAMQKSDELAETAAVLFKQLIGLGIEPNRLYICIVKDGAGNAEFWITDEDGTKVSAGFAANLNENGSFRAMYDGWQERKRSLTIDMQGKELEEYLRHLEALRVPFKGGLSQKRRVQTIAFFSHGFIGLASPEPQPRETAGLLERFASVFNLTFTRFNDLKLAEAQAHQAQLDLIQLQAAKKAAEETLLELRTTQEQLVQREKLASLGQLTAGIAHEIKNPLNFVTNFSALSTEMVDEVLATVSGDPSALKSDGVVALLSEVKSNLAKISEHGKRADGIVKSMLHHSRGGTGKLEPADLGPLIREFVNLAYHGMRAGKNPITPTIEFDLDESVGRVSLMAEEFSRVIVNLCQNAFDAMREKENAAVLKAGPKQYVPALLVRTRPGSLGVTVEIEDNGPGIPDEIRDKILQPFFTTKKGTQGTGLGLSIAHDIIRAHRGTLTFGGNHAGGATFTISLPVGS